MQTREYKYEFLFRRLKEQAEFLISFYGKKKGNKKATKLVKNLKKYFDPKRIEDLRIIRQQMELLGDRDILLCQLLYKSIEVRATVITHMLLAKSTNSEEKNLASDIEALKESVTA